MSGKQGFASMDAAKHREICVKGGKAVPPEKRSFSRDPEFAAIAGRKGGQSVAAEKRNFSRNKQLASENGRKGGLATAAKRRAKKEA